MISVQATIVNSRGLHARPAAKLAKLAARYNSSTTLYKGKRKADAKSVAALLMLAASEGTNLKIIIEGADEKEAATAVLELIASGFSDDAVPNNPQQPEAITENSNSDKLQMHKVSGIGIGNAVVNGRAHIHSLGATEVARYRIEKQQQAAEIKRYETALALVRSDFELLLQQITEMPGAAEIKPFIDLHLMLLADAEFSSKPQSLIRSRSINAEWALKERVEIISDNFRRLKDAYLRERQRDIEQVMNRLIAAMASNTNHSQTPITTGEKAILIAADLDPADVIQINRLGYKGFITESGGGNSHTAILARSMNIPALIGARGVLACLQHNSTVLLDTQRQIAIINPDSANIKKHKQAHKKDSVKRRHKSSGKGVLTKDKQQITLTTNIELPDETTATINSGADGIGLFRSEFLFMHRCDLPSEDEQFEIYRTVLSAMHPLPVVIRTLDIGGDKMPEHADAIPIGVNPALGVRAIRYCLAMPDLFMTQLRALLRAAAIHDNLRILLPMLAHPQELQRSITLLEVAKEQLRVTQEIDVAMPPVGAMIEVPAAVFIMRALAKQLSFFSIGTNDLIQYIMAADRNDETLTSLCDPMHPAVLQMLALIVENAKRTNLPVNLCGELASDVELTPLMLGLGLRQLSMHPVAIEQVRGQIKQTNCQTMHTITRRVLQAQDPASAREILKEGMRQQGQ